MSTCWRPITSLHHYIISGLYLSVALRTCVCLQVATLWHRNETRWRQAKPGKVCVRVRIVSGHGVAMEHTSERAREKKMGSPRGSLTCCCLFVREGSSRQLNGTSGSLGADARARARARPKGRRQWADAGRQECPAQARRAGAQGQRHGAHLPLASVKIPRTRLAFVVAGHLAGRVDLIICMQLTHARQTFCQVAPAPGARRTRPKGGPMNWAGRPAAVGHRLARVLCGAGATALN